MKIVDYKNLIEVKPMERSEALELLQRKLAKPGESQESRHLVEELEFMPLAIVQAASYIRYRAPRCSVSQYLRDFQKSEREAIKLLKTEAGQLYRDWEAKNSILVTWQISFDYIRQTKPSAAELLSLMSFFDRQGIPENLLRVQAESNHKSGSELLNDSSDEGDASESEMVDGFEDDITTLRDFSFISVSENSIFFTMHRLVQLTTRIWLKTHGQKEQWKERFISNLCYEFPTGEYENWEKCRPLFPHVKSAMSQRPESKEYLRKWATLLYRGAWYAQKSGNIADMRALASKSRKQRVVLLGAENEEALESTAMLAEAYRLEGWWEEAEKLHLQVMDTRKTKFGEDHYETLASINDLALTFRNQGRWEEAEKLQAQVMETSKTKLGEDHPTTLTNMANLATTYTSQGRLEEAVKLQVQVMETSKTKLGEDHPDTLTSMANLASTLWNQGRWEETEKLEVQVMDFRKMKLGDDHPNTLASMANLAFTWKFSGRNADAIDLLLACLAKQNKVLGPNHPETLSNLEALLEWETEGLNMNA
jgi:hypothetical protein